MVTPPMIGQPRIERRSRARRAGDRVAGAEEVRSASSTEGVEAAAAIAPEHDGMKRPPRRAGRRASDQSADGGASPKSARAPRPFAPLVAQIIANVMGLEQTRSRRRGSLADADALYRPKRERAKRSRGEA